MLLPPIWRRPLFWIACLVVLTVTGVFFYFWRFGYSSDSAVIGLMAKSILERGEHPIFVWKVGYQGVLLEGYAVAAFFKMFGVDPRILNLWNTLCLWLVFGALFAVVRRASHATQALVAVILLALSTPDLYALAMRTQPNYTEIFVFGLILVGLSQELIRHFYVENRPSTPRTVVLGALAGLVAGFGAYTYGQISFFFAAVGLQLVLAYARFALGAPGGYWAYLRGRPLLRAGTWINGVHLVFALVTYLVNVQRIDWPGGHVSFSSIGMMKISAAIFALYAAGDLWNRARARILGLWREAAAGMVAAIVGFSPTLIFAWVLHGKLADRTGMDGTLRDFLHRMGFAGTGLMNLVNLGPSSSLPTAIRWVVLIGVVAAMLTLLLRQIRAALAFIYARVPERKLLTLELGPLALLPWAVLPIFGLAAAVTDPASARYLLVLLFPLAIGAGELAVHGWQSGGGRRALTGLAIGILLTNNAWSLGSAIARSESRGFEGEQAVGALRELGIRYGYAQYWDGYTVDFFTGEQIVLEPTCSNYCPYYASPVREAKRIAYLDVDPPSQKPIDGKMEFYGQRYRLTDERHLGGDVIYVLEKLDPSS